VKLDLLLFLYPKNLYFALHVFAPSTLATTRNNIVDLFIFRVTNAGLAEGITRLQPSSDGKRIFETA